MNTVRVAISGYGVIGKRVADAIKAQDDMTLVGVADRRGRTQVERRPLLSRFLDTERTA